MNDHDLSRRLLVLRRTARMLETELRHGHMDDELLADIDAQLEQGIAADQRGAALRAYVDALRESTLTPRRDLLADTVRCCAKLSDAIDALTSRLR